MRGEFSSSIRSSQKMEEPEGPHDDSFDEVPILAADLLHLIPSLVGPHPLPCWCT